MKIRFRIKSFEFFCSVGFQTTQVGVNSKLADGNHFLMWDFDDVGLLDVAKSLNAVSDRFSLPPIDIISTGIPNHFHAYCFKRVPTELATFILASTKYLDHQFYTIGILRGYWTLRIHNKKNRVFKHVYRLAGWAEPNVKPSEISSFIEYYTKRS